jgi:hypothetical protein
MAKHDTTASKATAKKGKSAFLKGRPSSSSSKKPTAEIRILLAMAQQHAIGNEFACRKQVRTLADVPKEGSYNTFVNIMKKKGLLVTSEDNKGLKATEAGYEKLGPEAAAAPKTNEDVQAKLKETLKVPKARIMFDVLTDGRAHSRSELAQTIGYEENNGSFKTYIGSLGKYCDKFDDPDGNKMYQLKNIAFPFGRPE